MWTEARTSLTRMERAFNSLVSVSERAEELLLASRPAGGVWVVPDAVLRELAASLGIEIEVKELLDERLGPTT